MVDEQCMDELDPEDQKEFGDFAKKLKIQRKKRHIQELDPNNNTNKTKQQSKRTIKKEKANKWQEENNDNNNTKINYNSN